MMNAWRQIDFSNIDTPALLIDRDKVARNIQLAIRYAGGVERLRPHVKTHKMLEVARMQVAEGIRKFKCATIAEAEMLGMAGAEDVLIAYPVQGPKIGRVIALMVKYPETHYSILIDNPHTAGAINEKAQASGRVMDACIDINNGDNRTGVRIDKAWALAEALKPLPYVRLVGLHCYDGHIKMPSLDERTAVCRKAFEGILLLRETLQVEWRRAFPIVAGGCATFPVHARYHDVECSPGTFVFWDEGYASHYREQHFEKAAVLATRVVSRIDSHTYCLDLGYKSVASEFPFPRVAFLHPHSFIQLAHSEEHLVIKSTAPDVLSVGQLLLAFPYHICPTVALYEQVHVVRSGNIIAQWEVIARKRKITI